LIVAVYVKEGIVMASDSRISFHQKHLNGTTVTERLGVHVSNTTYETFLCPNGTGISACGDASINNAPIAGFIEQFIHEKVTESTPVTLIPQMLLDFFKELSPQLDAVFHVAGYSGVEKPEPYICTGNL